MRTFYLSALATTGLLTMAVSAAPLLPANMGYGLNLLIPGQTVIGADQARLGEVLRLQQDSQGRVLVNILLNGSVALADFKKQIQGLGLSVIAESVSYRKGILCAYLPLNKALSVAQMSGVRSVLLAPKPITDVGATTSQAVVVLKTDQVNAKGIEGQGITVGAMSDSYNTSKSKIKANNDIASGDLPGTGNPLGNTTPVVVLQDSPGGTDEGRAMLQLIHDLAPKAKLCFATANATEVNFAANIRNLADPSKACNADIIVDDISYFTEPFFSDGVIAQAVDDVSRGSSFPSKKVSFYTSAGNRASREGYVSDFRFVSDASARAGLTGENIQLSAIPASLSTGGFHNFASGQQVAISQTISVPAGVTATISFQWDDPFDVLPTGVTTDYNLFVFREDGSLCSTTDTINCIPGTDDNLSTNQPVELAQIVNGGSATTNFQLVITRKGATPATPKAVHLRYVAYGGITETEFYSYQTPVTFGHKVATGANGVAAYVYDSDLSTPAFTPTIESFTSPGPATIYFDTQGNRYLTPQVRLKPDIAAVDGTNTTFFPSGSLRLTDSEGDGFPNFFGTSAAAPHAAGVAALVLQAAGGSGSLTPTQLSKYLKQSAPVHDLDPSFSKALSSQGSTNLQVTATGDATASNEPNLFQVSLKASPSEALTELTIDLTGAALVFDPSTTTGFPFTIGTNKGNIGVTSQLIGTNQLKLTFTSFSTGDTLAFGIDRDLAATNGGGNGADLLGGATIRAKTTGAGTLNGTFVNVINLGYSTLDGYGLIDALAAVKLLP